MLKVVIVTLFSVIVARPGLADSVTLAWDPSSNPNVVAYHLYYGAASGKYTNFIALGLSTQATVTQLAAGTVYYFAATTIDSTGLESDFSPEAVYRPAAPPSTITLSGLVQVYTGTPKQVTVTTVPSGLAVDVEYNGLATPPTQAGTYQVVASIKAPGYTGMASGLLTIQKANATVRLNYTDHQTYNGTPRAASASTTPAGLAVRITYNGQSTAPSAAGTYQVAGSIIDNNYTGGTTSILTIDKAGAQILLSGLTRTYNGTGQQAVATTSPSGLAVSITYNGLATLPIQAGTYQAAAKIVNPNYSGSAAAAFVIQKAAVAIRLGNLIQIYDGKGKVAASDTSPIIAPVFLTYDGRPNLPTNAGLHIVRATITNSNNYVGSSSNVLSILKANASVTLANLNQVYDGTPKSVLTGVMPPGLKLIVTYNDQLQAPSAVGTYAAVGTVSDPNYAGSAMAWLTISAGTALTKSRTSTLGFTPNQVTTDLARSSRDNCCSFHGRKQPAMSRSGRAPIC
jgi:hypothetical protein